MVETETETEPRSERRPEAPHHPDRYDAPAVEAKWRARWAADDLYKVADDDPRPKWYSLTMYPYPSGVLHVGHWYAFAIPDTYARLQAMRGYNVLFPMGFDAFGLPAENAAIRHGIHPATWTFDNIPAMKEQYRQMGAMIDWSREVITCTPEYYHWNQWLFLRMLEQGLAYRANGPVWWCPTDQTGARQRAGAGRATSASAAAARSPSATWSSGTFRSPSTPRSCCTTPRARLARAGQDDAAELDRPLEGARLRFALETGDALEVFTPARHRSGAPTFMVLAPEHPWSPRSRRRAKRRRSRYVEPGPAADEIERQSTDEARPKTGVFTGAYAVNPVTDERIPVWIADYV
jgi:leucyl-tRNA synthetase